MEIRNRLE